MNNYVRNIRKEIDEIKINFVPDFISYLFLLKGLYELAKESNHFTNVIPLTKGMFVFSFIIYMMDLLTISVSLGFFLRLGGFITGFISQGLLLIISYEIIMGIKEIERHLVYLQTDKLFIAFKIMVVFSVITYFISFVSSFAIFVLVISIVINIYYLYRFSITKNLYY